MTRPRRTLAAVLAVLSGLAGVLVASATPAAATAGLDYQRLAGIKRWDTAVEVAKAAFPDGADTVVLANGFNLADALVANHLAGALDAPILLSLSTDIPDATVAGLRALGVTRAYLVGGSAQLGSAVADELDDLDIDLVTQIGGSDRFDTAQRIASVAAELRPVGELDGKRTAFVTTGSDGSTDALVAGPLSFAGGFPILLSLPASIGDLGADARAALQSLQIEHVILIGGTAAVPDSVRAEIEGLSITTDRISGADRFETAANLADFAIDEVGFRTDHVNIATGIALPDAIAGGPHAGRERAPILLGALVVPSATCDQLAAATTTLSTGHVFGGASAITLADELALEECGGADPTNQSFVLSPTSDADLLVDATRTFTASGIASDSTVAIALVDCAAVSASAQVFTFADSAEPADRADGIGTDAAAAATITSVNGLATDADLVTDVVVTAGEVSFVVTGDANGCVRPVVFVDGDGDDALALDATDQPAEPFAVGGASQVAAVAGLTASAQSPTRAFGTATTITAQITDPADPTPAPGRSVVFVAEQVVEGQAPPQFGQDGCDSNDPSVSRASVTSVTAVTDLNGAAVFALPGPADPNAGFGDEVVRCVVAFLDADGDGVLDDGELTAGEVEVRYADAEPEADAVAVAVDATTRLAATTGSVTVTVLDQYGDPVDNASPTIEVFRNGATSATIRQVVTTGDDGTASIAVSGPTTGADDIVVACLENPTETPQNSSCDVVGGDGSADAPNARADRFWVTYQTTSTTIAHDSCVLAGSAEGQFVEVGEAGSARNVRLHYDGGDDFAVIGNTGSATTVLLSDFASRLDPGDRLQVAYLVDGASSWRLVEDGDCTAGSFPPEASTDGSVAPF